MIKDIIRQKLTPATGTESGNQSVVDFNLSVEGVLYIPSGETDTFNGGKIRDGALRITGGKLKYYYDEEWLETSSDILIGRGLIINPDTGAIELDLEAKTLVSPSISSSWTLFKADGTTPYTPSTSNDKNIIVDKGVRANLNSYFEYPAPSSIQKAPVTITGNYGNTIPNPDTPSNSLIVNNVNTDNTYSVNFNSPKTGLIVENNQVVFPIGNDVTSDSTSIRFMYKLYYGTTVKDSNILDSDILSLTNEFKDNRFKSLNNFGGGGTRILVGVPHSFGEASFKINGLANTAFTMVRSNSDFTNLAGFTDKIDVYLSDNIYNSPLDSFEIV